MYVFHDFKQVALAVASTLISVSKPPVGAEVTLGREITLGRLGSVSTAPVVPPIMMGASFAQATAMPMAASTLDTAEMPQYVNKSDSGDMV